MESCLSPRLSWERSEEDAFADFASQLSALCDVIRKQRRRMVVALDEIDVILPTSSESDESYARLCQSLLVFLLQRAKQDSVLVPIFAGRSSDVLKQLTSDKIDGGIIPRYMPYMDEKECSEMVEGIGRKMYLTWSPKSLESIFQETGGHVHMVRCLCSQMIKTLRQSNYDQEHVARVREDFCRSPNNWIQATWNRDFGEAEKAVLRKLASKSGWSPKEVSSVILSDSDRETLQSLRNYGILEQQKDSDILRVRGDIVRDWISNYGRQ